MSSPTYTGRTRQRRTRRGVRVVDFLARWVIRIGGISALLAVLLVCVFLVTTAVPLAFSPAIAPATSSQPAAPLDDLALRLDDSQRLLAVLSRDGKLRLVETASGRTLQEQSLDGPLTACAWAPGESEAAIALADGSIRLVEIGFEPSDWAGPGDSGSQEPLFADGFYRWRTAEGSWRQARLTLAEGATIREASDDPVAALDFVRIRTGHVTALVTRGGAAQVIRVRQKRRLRDDQVKTETLRFDLPIPPEAGGAPSFVRISGLGDNVYAAWDDGRLVRFALGVGEPKTLESLDLVDAAGAQLTALDFLVGRTTLVAGDSLGRVRGWFPVPRDENGVQTTRLTCVHKLPNGPAAVTAMAASPEKRLVVVGFGDGRVRVDHITTDQTLVSASIPRPPRAVGFAPALDGLVVASSEELARFDLDLKHPEVTLASLFRPVWYEYYAEPGHTWQSSGGAAHEPKLGFMPLVFGTLKATVFSLLFAMPLALLGAIYSSEFLHPSTRSRVKPMIEMMASLPSVVLGFLAALVFAPFVARFVPAMLVAMYSVPATLVAGAFLWQLLPQRLTIRLARWRFLCSAVGVPIGVALALLIDDACERWFFAGDVRAWLDGQIGRAWGGWFFILLAPAAAGLAVAMGLWINPWLRRRGADWSYGRFATVNTLKFLLAFAAAMAAAAAAAWMLDAAGLDPRGSLVGGYVQRNALIVGFAMGFAVIPIIYTLAEDALSAVPDHLRSASLGAGATPWQTAVRVVIPTAASGLFSAIMVGLGRAVGETMIVLMAAGNTPLMDWNLFNGMRTLSAAIATELPEAAAGSTEYRVLFLAALVLFALTFALNTLAEIVRQRFRKRAVAL